MKNEDIRKETLDEINARNILPIDENRFDDLHLASMDVDYQTNLIGELFVSEKS